jgi:hypothetical protein
MQRILIMGDSWADWRIPQIHGIDRETDDHHITGKLKKLGYAVTNCSRTGNSNLMALRSAKAATASEQFDWVIWFHTEVFRDDNMYDADKPFYLMDMARDLAREQYKMFEQFRNEHNLKAIVIGAQAPTFDFIRDYIKIEMLIEDWRSEIMNFKFPFCHILALNEFYEILQKPMCLDTPRDRIKFLGEVEIIYNMCDKRRDLFPDSAHPGEGPHTDLTKKLHDFIMEHVYGQNLHNR